MSSIINEQENTVLTRQQITELIRSIYREEREAESRGKEIPSRQKMYDLLKALPEETCREYEKTIVDYSVQWNDTVLSNDLMELVELIRKNPAPDTDDNKVAFAALAVAVNHHRRMRNSTEEENLLERYKPFFEGDHVFFRHMWLLSLMGRVYSFDEQELENMLVLAEQNYKGLKNNAGGAHAFAECVVFALELDTVSPKEFLKNSRNHWIGKAEKAINDSIAGDPQYAKFYCTYGRLLAMEGKFERALEYVAKAIDKEDDDRADYSIRIGQYLSYSQQIQARQQMQAREDVLQKKMQDYQTQAQETMKQYQNQLEEQEKRTITKNMEFLGLFAGIVSFTIGSLTITGAIAEQSIFAAAGLIIVLMGALMGVFAAFGVILHGVKDKGIRNIIVMLAALAIIAGGMYFCLK